MGRLASTSARSGNGSPAKYALDIPAEGCPEGGNVALEPRQAARHAPNVAGRPTDRLVPLLQLRTQCLFAARKVASDRVYHRFVRL